MGLNSDRALEALVDLDSDDELGPPMGLDSLVEDEIHQSVDTREDLYPLPPVPAQPEAEQLAPKRTELEPEMSAAQVERLVERVLPSLRDELHQSLERIAWEAFGDLSKQVVVQAVERVEKIAWETVPKLAETLIQEEIRKIDHGE